MIFCTTCGTESHDQAFFCDHCGRQLAAALPTVCGECGSRNRISAKFCGTCGTGFERTVAATTVGEAPTPHPAIVDDVTAPQAPRPPSEDRAAANRSRPTGRPARTPVEAAAAARPAPAAVTSSAAAAAAAGPSAVADATQPTAPREPRVTRATRPPRPPSRPFAETAREWAAPRQADILLYLGAFLLVAAALLFVSSQGEGVSSGLRVALLLVYTFAFIVAGIVAQRIERIREAGMVFLAIGALITPLNFLLIYTEILEARDVSRGVVWLIGSVYSALFYALLWQRGYGKLYALPAAISVISAWAALAVVIELPNEWLGSWWIFFLVVASAVADRVRAYGLAVALGVGLLLALTLLAQLIESNLDQGEFSLAVSLALITAWLAQTGWALRAPWLLPAGATAAIATGMASTRAADLEADWAAYSALAIGFLAVYTRDVWARWDLDVARFGWVYAALCGLAPLAFISTYEDGANGAVSFLLGAALLGSVSWRDQIDGFGLLSPASRGMETDLVERTLFGWIGFVLLLIGVAYTQRELGIEQPNTGWVYLVIGLATIGLLARTGRNWTPALAVLIPPAVLAMLVSLPDPDAYPGHVALYLGVPAGAYLGAFAVTRRWPITLVAAVIGAFAAAAAWDALGWPAWTAAVAYAAAGTGLFAVLTPLRTYRPEITPTIVATLSWGFVLLGPLVAFGPLLPIEDGSSAEVIVSPEYRAGLYLLLLIAPLLAFEGWRFKNWTVTAAATTLAALVVAPLWASYDWPGWTLAITYLAAGVVRFVTMSGVRTYRNERGQLPIVVLSWGLTLAAPVTAWIALSDRMASAGGVAVEMVEYRTLIGVVLAHAPLLLYEARRLRALWALVSASVVAMTALLMAIAVYRFDEVQAYTVPVGLFWIAFGLVVRRSALVLDRHLMLHELVLLGGVAILLAPQAREGLQPDGAAWGGIVMLEGVLFLLTGLVLASRWLTVSGVVAVSAVAIRWLAVSTGDTIPYWLTLGGVGLALLLLGTVLLLARERWIAVKDSTVSWWARSATLRGVSIDSPVVFGPATVAVIAIIVSSIEHWTILSIP